MSKQVLFNFYLKYTKFPNAKFLFWSCALDTTLDTIAKKDYENLTKSLGDKSISVKGFKVISEISDFNESEYSDYVKRNPVFLSIKKNYGNCSPYLNSCANLENYYKIDFNNDFINFIKNISDNTELEFSEYTKVCIQKESIAAIKELIGLDILKQESVPGSVAIYHRLPCFELKANYNCKLDDRYISYHFEVEEKSDYFIEIEIPDGNKIIYKKLFKLYPNEKIVLPNYPELEQFGQIHITIFKKFDNQTSVVYEENGTLIRSFSFGINSYGGNYKLIRNRFAEKKNEHISVGSYSLNTSKSKEFDPFYFEKDYKKSLFGTEKQYLDSYFFPSNKNGRERFLDWVRDVLQSAKEVSIIDPFFDYDGLRDFDACNTTCFSLSVLTTDPQDCPREKTSEKKKEDDNLVLGIQTAFPQSKIYFISRKKLHDRYLIVSNDEETKYYSFSNSWNGTVNNYSLFVQELDYEISLQVKDEYSKYLNEENLQFDKCEQFSTETEEDNEKKNISDGYANKLLIDIKNMNTSITNDDFLCMFEKLFTASYYGNEVLAEEDLLSLCVSKFSLVDDFDLFIEKYIKSVLISQRNNFQKKGRFIKSEKSIDKYSDIDECINRVLKQDFYSSCPCYDLEISYWEYKIIESAFSYSPEIVINKLIEQEKEICKINLCEEKEDYYVSEQIISSFLAKNYEYIQNDSIEDIIFFANRTKNLYCKVYIFFWIINNDGFGEYKDRLEKLKDINICSISYCKILGIIASDCIRIKHQSSVQKIQDIENIIQASFTGKSEELIYFAVNAYLLSYGISFEHFRRYIDKNSNVKDSLEKIFLLFSLNDVPNGSLFKIISENCENLSQYLPSRKKDPRITDVNKFINYIHFLGTILATLIEKNPSMLKGIIYKFDIHPEFIFEINRLPKNDFDCYVLLIILTSLFYLKNKNSIEEVRKISWYIPYILNKHNNDYYDLSLKILDVYLTFLNDDERNDLSQKLISEKMKKLILSTNDNCPSDINELLGFLKTIQFKDYNKTNNISYMLSLFINYIIYWLYEDKDNVLLILEEIKEIFNQQISNEKINTFVSDGINYYKEQNEYNKNKFIDDMKSLYCPFSAIWFIEDDK